MRLAIFVDQLFWRDGDVLSTNESYALFFARFIGSVSEIVFVGREVPEPGRGAFVLDHPNISLCPMPYYPNLYQLWRANPRIYRQIRQTVRQHAKSWDAILISGQNPIGKIVARQCAALGVPIVPVVRQNFIQQMSAHRGAKRALAMMAARALEWDFKRLARGRLTLTVGTEMTEAYGHVSDRVCNHFPCLVDEAQFRMFSAMSAGADPTRLLSVGRLAPEKGHTYLFEAMALLNARGIACHLDVVGTGSLEQELKRKAVDLGLEAQITFHGFVPFESALIDLYQQAGAVVFSSTTEGFPQVINESLSIGLPTIATTVGGIPGFLTDNITALLVPPRDVPSLACAIERVVRDEELRKRLRHNGRALMASHTLEANRELVMKAICDEVYGSQA